MKWTTALAACLALPALAGCQMGDLEPDEAVGSDSQAIIGGTNVGSSSKWPFVVRLDIGGTCTGTLVAPNVVLTAAHCVENFFGGRARFGTGPGNWIQDPESGSDLAITIDEAFIHRGYAGFDDKDIALLKLSRSAPDIITPVPFNTDPLDESFTGTSVTTVGFGNNVPPTGGPETGKGAGVMREVTYSVDGVTAEHLLVGDMTENTCQGDSGGPTFAMINGELRVVAVTSFGTFQCQGQSNVTRTDRYAPEFLFEVMSAWSGPCAQDGQCNEEAECEYPDPDCDICGLDGICGQECERVDLDCPLAGLAGDSCEDRYDCESRVCAVAPDDDRVKYCSDVCDPAVSAADQCDVPLTRCGKSPEGEDVCQFAGPTPGTQGAACTDSSECIGACDPNNAICVEVCDSNADCSEEFECRSVGGTKVCTVPEAGGCTATDGAGRGNLAVIGLAFLGLLAFRRRRN